MDRGDGGISGQSLAGLAAQAVGAAPALLFNAGSFGVSAACLLAIRARAPGSERDGRKAARPGTTIRAEIAEGARFITGDPLLRRLTLWPALANLTYGGAVALFVVFLIRVAGIGKAEVGLLMASGGVGGILGAMAARPSARRLGTARALLLYAFGSGLIGLVIPLTGPGLRAGWYVIASVAMATGLTGGNIILQTFRQSYCPPALLGRVTASQRFLVFGTVPVGALLAGGLGTALGIRPALWILLAGFLLSGLLLFTPATLSQRDRPGPARYHRA